MATEIQLKHPDFYSDLDLSLNIHPLTGDLTPIKETKAIVRAVKNIFKLNAFDIPFRPDLKSELTELLFEPNNQLTTISIRTSLEWIFKKLEPRAKITNMEVESADGGLGYTITVWFLIRSLNVEEKFTFYVQRAH